MKESLKKLLRELRVYGLENNIPNVTDEVAGFLSMLIRMKKPAHILEIGCANGYSTIWMAEAADRTGADIHTIDHSLPTFTAAKGNLERAGLSHVVHFYFGDAVDIICQMTLTFDFVFVDGEKASYLDFWKGIEGHLADGALVVFDDMLAFSEKTQPFYDYIKKAEGIDRLMIPIDQNDGILLVLKS